MTPPADPVFATTRWTQVLAARGESVQARQALSDLCAAYYEPVVAYLRHHHRTEDDARELAHRFFELVLHRRAFDAATPDQGRFRSYLLGAVKHFLTEGTLKVAIHRLRRRFRELVKTEIAQTLSDPSAVREELRYLVEVLAAKTELD